MNQFHLSKQVKCSIIMVMFIHLWRCSFQIGLMKYWWKCVGNNSNFELHSLKSKFNCDFLNLHNCNFTFILFNHNCIFACLHMIITHDKHLHLYNQILDSKDEKIKNILTWTQLQVYFVSIHVDHIWIDPLIWVGNICNTCMYTS